MSVYLQSVYLQSVAVRTWISREFKDCSWPWTLTMNKSSLSSWLAVSKLAGKKPTLTLKLERPHWIQSSLVFYRVRVKGQVDCLSDHYSLSTPSLSTAVGDRNGRRWMASVRLHVGDRNLSSPPLAPCLFPPHSVVTSSLLCTPAAANNRQYRWQLHTSRRYVTLHVTGNTICNITTRRMSTTCCS